MTWIPAYAGMTQKNSQKWEFLKDLGVALVIAGSDNQGLGKISALCGGHHGRHSETQDHGLGISPAFGSETDFVAAAPDRDYRYGVRIETDVLRFQ